jgi:hypothetical protein
LDGRSLGRDGSSRFIRIMGKSSRYPKLRLSALSTHRGIRLQALNKAIEGLCDDTDLLRLTTKYDRLAIRH